MSRVILESHRLQQSLILSFTTVDRSISPILLRKYSSNIDLTKVADAYKSVLLYFSAIYFSLGIKWYFDRMLLDTS